MRSGICGRRARRIVGVCLAALVTCASTTAAVRPHEAGATARSVAAGIVAPGATPVRAALQPALSGNADLGALELSGIDLPAFSADVTSYSVDVGYALDSTTVRATAADAGARVSISVGAATSSTTQRWTALAVGSNEITVTVVAEDGSAKAYTVTVSRAQPSSDESLATLSLTGIDIGTFDAATLEYSASAPRGTFVTTVSAVAAHSGATVKFLDTDADPGTPGHQVLLDTGNNDVSISDVSDLSPVATLTELRRLDLRVNAIQDLSPVATLTELRRLDLRVNAIQDLSPVATLTELQRLDLDANAINGGA